MKVRSGFVSNSSSSSFIVAAKSPIITLTLSVDLSQYGQALSTEQQLRKYLKEYYVDEVDDPDVAKMHKDLSEKIANGMTIFTGSFDSDGEPLEEFLCENGIPPIEGLDIIESSGGY